MGTFYAVKNNRNLYDITNANEGKIVEAVLVDNVPISVPVNYIEVNLPKDNLPKLMTLRQWQSTFQFKKSEDIAKETHRWKNRTR